MVISDIHGESDRIMSYSANYITENWYLWNCCRSLIPSSFSTGSTSLQCSGCHPPVCCCSLLEAVHPHGNSRDTSCFVRFTWASPSSISNCVAAVTLPVYLPICVLSLAAFQTVAWAALSTAVSAFALLHALCSAPGSHPHLKCLNRFGCSVVSAERFWAYRWNETLWRGLC